MKLKHLKIIKVNNGNKNQVQKFLKAQKEIILKDIVKENEQEHLERE